MSMAGVRKGGWMERTEVELAAQEDSPRTTGGFSNSADLLSGVILETNTGFVSEQC